MRRRCPLRISAASVALARDHAARDLEIQYIREYYDSRDRVVDRAPRDDPPPCYGTSGHCPRG
ncbi:hypothetical protein [Frigoribacterium salinisoli]